MNLRDTGSKEHPVFTSTFIPTRLLIDSIIYTSQIFPGPCILCDTFTVDKDVCSTLS